MANPVIDECDSLITISNQLRVKNGNFENYVNCLNEEIFSQKRELDMAIWEMENLSEDCKDLKQKLKSSNLQLIKLDQG